MPIVQASVTAVRAPTTQPTPVAPASPRAPILQDVTEASPVLNQPLAVVLDIARTQSPPDGIKHTIWDVYSLKHRVCSDRRATRSRPAGTGLG